MNRGNQDVGGVEGMLTHKIMVYNIAVFFWDNSFCSALFTDEYDRLLFIPFALSAGQML